MVAETAADESKCHFRGPHGDPCEEPAEWLVYHGLNGTSNLDPAMLGAAEFALACTEHAGPKVAADSSEVIILVRMEAD